MEEGKSVSSRRKRQKVVSMPDFEAKNPRYAGLKGSDMVRALLRPKDPKVEEVLDRNRTPPRPTRAKLLTLCR